MIPFEVTDRQAEILAAVASGHNYQEAGEQLFLSRHTIRRHMNEVVERTTAKTTTQAIAQAVAAGRIVVCANGEFTPV